MNLKEQVQKCKDKIEFISYSSFLNDLFKMSLCSLMLTLL